MFVVLEPGSPPSAIGHGAAVLVVAMSDAAESMDFVWAAEDALRSRTPVIVVCRSVPEATYRTYSWYAAYDLFWCGGWCGKNLISSVNSSNAQRSHTYCGIVTFD